MKKVEVKDNQCTVTIDPDKVFTKEDDVCFIINKPPRYGHISLTMRDLDTIQTVIKKFKKENWQELLEKEK